MKWLKLVQYVSTIANGGYRIQPRIVREIRDPGDGENELGPVVQAMQPNVLNKVNVSDEVLRRVQEGFWDVFHAPGGTGTSVYHLPANRPMQAAGKTGTAEAYADGRKVWNTTLVAYAPYQKPEIAMSVQIPAAYLDGSPSNRLNHEIGERVLNAYFDLKAERANIESKDDD